MNSNEFLIWEQLSQDTIDVKRVYIDIAEDLIAGILLSQIIYWNLPNKEGKTKLRVKKNEELWLAKGREDWWEECRITSKQFDRAIKILEKKDLVEKQIFKFDGNPTTHIKLRLEVLTQCLSVFYQRGITNLPKGEERNSPKGKNLNKEYNKEYNKDKSQSVSPGEDKTNYENKNLKKDKQKTDRQTDRPSQIIEEVKEIYGEDIVNQALEEKMTNCKATGGKPYREYLTKCCEELKDLKNISVNKTYTPKFTHEHSKSDLDEAIRRKEQMSMELASEEVPGNHLNDL